MASLSAAAWNAAAGCYDALWLIMDVFLEPFPISRDFFGFLRFEIGFGITTTQYSVSIMSERNNRTEPATPG